MEAEEIKGKIGDFLKKALGLDMSTEKTLITNAYTGKAKFLNYEINRSRADNVVKEIGNHSRRTANAILWFSIPTKVIKEWEAKVSKNGKILHRKSISALSDYDIITTYEVELQGLINYYAIAHNVITQMGRLRYLWQESLLKTLAIKHKISKPTADKTYRKFLTTDGRRIVGVDVARGTKKPLIASFGKKPICRNANVAIRDDYQTIYRGRNELLTRLMTDVCEICGNTENVEGHHIRKLADLNKQYKGKQEIPIWAQKMMTIRRKTLFVCRECHERIHNGTYDGAKLTHIQLESRIR